MIICKYKNSDGSPGLPSLFLLSVNNFSKQGGCCGTVYLYFYEISYLVTLAVEHGCAVLFGASEELLLLTL